MQTSLWIQFAIALCIALGSYFWMRSLKKALRASPEDKRLKKKKRWAVFVCFIGAWFACGRLLTLLFGTSYKELEVSLFASKMDFLGMQLSSTIVVTWYVIAALLVLALLFRIFIVPRFQDKPKGLQNVIELSIEAVDRYTKGQTACYTDALACYMFTIASLLIGCAFVELLGVRPPTADIVMTISLALVTFVLINYYGIKKRGVGGRLKSLAQPSPVIFPMKLLSDVAIPVSLACRLFGNMLGGLIVMDLLKSALGANGVGITPWVGLYFNVFHPLIQAYIFITLSLTFINEAVE